MDEEEVYEEEETSEDHDYMYIDEDGYGWYEEDGELVFEEIPDDYEYVEEDPIVYEDEYEELIFDGDEYVESDYRSASEEELYEEYEADEDTEYGYEEYDVTMEDYEAGLGNISPVYYAEDEEYEPNVRPGGFAPYDVSNYLPSSVAEEIGVVPVDNSDLLHDPDDVAYLEPMDTIRPSPFDPYYYTAYTMTSADQDEYDEYWQWLSSLGIDVQHYSERPEYAQAQQGS